MCGVSCCGGSDRRASSRRGDDPPRRRYSRIRTDDPYGFISNRSPTTRYVGPSSTTIRASHDHGP